MKRIRRLSGPTTGIQDYHLALGDSKSSWDQLRSHNGGQFYRELLSSLIANQHGLCGYCESTIQGIDRQVEHVIPRSHPQRGGQGTLDYNNMIVCCLGGTIRDHRRARRNSREVSCGQAKGNQVDPDFIYPRDLPAVPSLMQVNWTGIVEPDPKACARCNIPIVLVEKTISILGLNGDRLVHYRRKIWEKLARIWKDQFHSHQLMKEAAALELRPDDTNCPNAFFNAFFTARRSFFSKYAEIVLSESPHSWI